MDLYSAVKLYESYANKENFDETKTESSSTVSIIGLIVSLLISLYAVYLSWSCNSALNMSVGLKLLYAFFAFLFGLLYLLFYVIFRAGQCKSQNVPSSTVVSKGGKRN
jgi:uncharacterized membrane protein